MKSVLKCIYVILFLILIASSSALLILVASENMQNLHSNNEKVGKQLNTGENIVRENLWKSESVSCDKKDSKNINNFPLRKDEDFTKSNEDNIEEKLNYLERDDTMNSVEIVKITEAAKQKQKKINEPYLSESNIISDSNISFEITSTNNNIGNDILSSSSLDEKKITSLPNMDELTNDPAISRDIPPDKVEQRIIDSGGSTITSTILNDDQQLYTEPKIIPDTKNSENSLESNVTEEKPIPVFSEWAQKQMEEAEKNLEKNVVNVSSMKKNITNGNKQVPHLLKLRVKNYASPDCGAKIITSNSEAQNTGALLTSSKDEYMLSPCTSRIWFVVELCEAIQAKQIDFANFELFSSSPKNFSVAVSNRFPTRDWSNVGRYIAEDTRNIQSFDLFPHLFGKYVRVDVHSHYNSEHFCPISLLRVYGTSEFEAFDSENRNPYEDIDDVDDEIVQAEPTKKEDNNLFKSASDAVMSIVKKAAQVLSKEKPSRIEFNESSNILCFTPIFDAFSCSNCSQITNDNVNYLLSCKYKKLNQLLSIKQILFHLIRSQVCFDRFNIDINHSKKMFYHNWSKNILSSPDLITKDKYQFKHSREYSENFNEKDFFIDEKRSYYLSSINLDYLGAMCHILKYQNLIDSNLQDIFFKLKENSLNLTTEEMQTNGDSILNEKVIEELEIYSNTDRTNQIEKTQSHVIAETGADSSVENNSNDVTFSKEDIKENKLNLETTTSIEDKSIQNIDPIINEGINIFNIVDNCVTEEDNLESISEDSSKEKPIYSGHKINDRSEEVLESSSTSIPPIILSKVKEDDSQWENYEKLFNEQLSSDMNLSGNQIIGNINSVGTNQYKSSQHTESIFTRLSNRIKALERNMSLSGQYLEELSRRYKKQVEELQISFSKTLTAIEDQNRRFTELELVLQKQNAVLKSNLDELNVKLHFWMFILIIVTIIGLIYILTSFYSVTLIGRRQKSLYKKFEETSVRRKDNNEKFKRRKSADGVPKNININSTKKIRRPSEEAMKINASYKDLMIEDTCNDDDSIDNLNSCEEFCGNNSESSDCNRKSNVRNRKLSICYSKENQPIIRNNPLLFNFNKEQNLKDVNKFTKNYINSSHNSKEFNVFNNDDADSETIPEEIIVVDDESDQFIAGDSPYEYITKKSNSFKSSKNSSDKNKKNSKTAKLKKSESSSDKIRRLSSPSFLKSPFNKKTTTESTGWEWIRNGNNKNRQSSKVVSIGSPNNKKYFKYVIHNSLDSDQNIFVERNPSPNSTLSEQIIFHTSINNSENDSLRTTNSESSSLQAGVEGISNNKMEELGTNTSTNNSNSNCISNDNDGKNKAKKQRSFKKIFKKVF